MKILRKSIHDDECNVQAMDFKTLANLQLSHDGRLYIQHDIIETDIASLYKSECASLNFKVVCFLSNVLPRYWPEKKRSQKLIQLKHDTKVKSVQLNYNIEKNIGLFFTGSFPQRAAKFGTRCKTMILTGWSEPRPHFC